MITQSQTCNHDDVCDVRLAVPGRVQRAVVCFSEHDGNNSVPLVPLVCSQGSVQECCAHLRLGHLHRRLPLYSNLQLVGGSLSLLGGQGRSSADWCSFQ